MTVASHTVLTRKEQQVLTALRSLEWGTLTVTVQDRDIKTIRTEVVEKL